MSTGRAGVQRNTIAGGVMAHNFTVSGDMDKEIAAGSVEGQTKC